MTDIGFRTGIARVAGANYDFEISATCHDNGGIEYRMTSFTKDGEPAPMRQQPFSNNAGFGVQLIYHARVDGGEIMPVGNTNPQFNNQVSLLPYNWGNAPDAEVLAAGSQIITRFFMPDGEETVRFDQSSPEIRQVLDPCVRARPQTNQPVEASAETTIAPSPASVPQRTETVERFTSAEQALIDNVRTLEEQCRGGSGDDPNTERACAERDGAYDRMIAGGICFGRHADPDAASYRYHRCGPGSIR